MDSNDDIIHLDRKTILDHLHQEYTALRALTDRLTEADANRAGVVGYWSARELMAHLVYWNRFPVDELNIVRRGEEFVYPEGAEDEINARAVDAAKNTSWPVILAEFEQTYQVIRETIQALPDENFTPESPLTERLGDSIAGAFGNNTWEHYALHREQLAAWMRDQDLLN